MCLERTGHFSLLGSKQSFNKTRGSGRRIRIGKVVFFGDIAYVVDLLPATTVLRDLYLFNYRELTRHLLSDESFTATKISQDYAYLPRLQLWTIP